MIALSIVLKSSLVLLVVLLAAAALRRRSAAVRDAWLAAGIAGALLLPAASLVVPEWQVLDEPVVPVLLQPGPSTPSTIPPADLPAAAGGLAPTGRGWPWAAMVGLGWGIGALGSIAALSIGLVRLRRITTAAVAANAACRDVAPELAGRLGVTRPVTVLFTAHPLAPLTWGHRAPRILLPQEAVSWPADRLRIVIAHELAHIARGDWSTHLQGELLRAVYWFNPLAWLVCRRRQQESERACDDRVLALGVDGADYAAQLVDLARMARQGPWLPAPAVVRATGLERRVRAMLTPGLNRSAVSARGRAAVAAAALALVVAVAGVSAAQALASFSGSIVDPQNAVLPAVRVMLTNTATDVKIEVRSDRNGRFEFPPLEPGTYNVEVELPGFSSLRSTVRLEAGQRMEPNLQLAVGSLEETVTVRDPGTNETAMPRIQTVAARKTPICPQGPVTNGPRIGGNIRPPVKIRSVAPIYPLAYRGSGRTVQVELDATINPDGTIGEIRTVGSPIGDFAQSAIAAVREWAFDSTLLNCEPVPVRMSVHVAFVP
ncbi:MAG: M56 family metallopeptidase [Vicinamibacterales bacterium]